MHKYCCVHWQQQTLPALQLGTILGRPLQAPQQLELVVHGKVPRPLLAGSTAALQHLCFRACCRDIHPTAPIYDSTASAFLGAQ